MILLVDAYNVIRFLHPGGRHAHEAQIAWFLAQLSSYRKSKRAEITEIIAVFDGGLFSRKLREIVGGIVVVYAGAGRKADDVLVQYAGELRERGLLITNDRELQRRALVLKSSSMDVAVFWRLVEAVSVRQKVIESALVHEYDKLVITKYSHDNGIEDETDYSQDDIDSLMISGSLQHEHVVIKKEDRPVGGRTSGRAVSKKNRFNQVLRKKLG